MNLTDLEGCGIPTRMERLLGATGESCDINLSSHCTATVQAPRQVAATAILLFHSTT